MLASHVVGSSTYQSARLPLRSQFAEIVIMYRSYLQDEYEKQSPATFVDVSAVRANFCMRFHTTVMQQNIPFSTKFVEKLSENDKIVLFQPSQPPFLSVPSVVFTGSLLVALKRAVLLAIR